MAKTYTVENTRSGYKLLVKWPDTGSSISMAYLPNKIGRAIIEVEDEGYEAKGRNAIEESRRANLGSLFS